VKKSIGALLLAALVTTVITGCADPAEDPAKTEQPTEPTTPTEPKKEQPAGDVSENAPSQESTDASHAEIRAAFGLDGYVTVNPMMLTNIAMGKMDAMDLTPQQGLALAKAISAAMAESGWQQGDLPTGIFLARDGSAFAIGHKRKNGELHLQSYEHQADGSWKKVKSEDKPGTK